MVGRGEGIFELILYIQSIFQRQRGNESQRDP
jgi:hypothetical protein